MFTEDVSLWEVTLKTLPDSIVSGNESFKQTSPIQFFFFRYPLETDLHFLVSRHSSLTSSPLHPFLIYLIRHKKNKKSWLERFISKHEKQMKHYYSKCTGCAGIILSVFRYHKLRRKDLKSILLYSIYK